MTDKNSRRSKLYVVQKFGQTAPPHAEDRRGARPVVTSIGEHDLNIANVDDI